MKDFQLDGWSGLINVYDDTEDVIKNVVNKLIGVYIYNERLTVSYNEQNTFVTQYPYRANTTMLFYNGILQMPISDYVEVGGHTIRFLEPVHLYTDDKIDVCYTAEPNENGTIDPINISN